MPGGARQYCFLTLTLTRKFFELSGHAARPSRITSAHHQTVFKPPFMTASAPPLAFMIVNSDTRWLPDTETFGSNAGRVCLQRDESWPPATSLRSASKWCACSDQESSRRPHKAVENCDGRILSAACPGTLFHFGAIGGLAVSRS